MIRKTIVALGLALVLQSCGFTVNRWPTPVRESTAKVCGYGYLSLFIDAGILTGAVLLAREDSLDARFRVGVLSLSTASAIAYVAAMYSGRGAGGCFVNMGASIQKDAWAELAAPGTHRGRCRDAEESCDEGLICLVPELAADAKMIDPKIVAYARATDGGICVTRDDVGLTGCSSDADCRDGTFCDHALRWAMTDQGTCVIGNRSTPATATTTPVPAPATLAPTPMPATP